MSQANVCRLCINICKDYYKRLYDDVEVYETTVKYFDPMFLNMEYRLIAICLECWSHMADFRQFQLSVLQAQTKLAKEQKSEERSGLMEWNDMSQENLCRFCVTIRNDFTRLQDDNEIFEIVARYFDAKLLNVKGISAGICLKCWNHILDFHKFQESVVQAQTKLQQYERKSEEVIVKTEVLEFPECENLHDTNLKSTVVEETYSITVISEVPEYQKDDTNVIVKEEPEFFTLPELELIDIHSENQCSSEYEVPVPLTNTTKRERTCSAKTDTDYDIDSSNDEDDDDPTRKSNEKRKSNQELDEIIAEWRPILECVICTEPCTTFTLLQRHFESKHPNEKVYICCCQCKLRTHYYIEEHLRFHNDPNLFKCQICGQCHTTRLRLRRHMDYWHSAKNTAEFRPCAEKSALICTECGNTAKTVGALRKHMHRHEAKRKFKCAICDKGFRGRNDLRTHLASHAQEHKCPNCTMTFKYISRLKKHQTNEHGTLGTSQPNDVNC